MIRAVILLGGPSRKASYGTYEHASPLFPVCGMEIIGHLMNAIRKLHNLKDFVLMGYYDKKCFQHFQEKQQRVLGVTVSYIQEESELGTGGGLAQNIEHLFNEVDDLLVIHSDICCDLSCEEFYNFHKKKQAICSVMTVRVSKEESTKYGCLIKDTETDQLIHHAEKPEKYISNLVNCGVYLFNAGFKKSILYAKEKKETSLSDELVHKPYVKFIKRSTDLNAKYLSLENDVFKQMDREQVYLYEHNGFWQSIKSTQELLKANELLLQYYSQYPYNLNNSEYELQDKNVLVHKSARVHPSARLGNNVVIGAGCEIGEGVRIKDSVILDGVEIKNYSYISNSVICYNSIIGYWCRIEGGVQFLGPCVTVDNELYLRDVVCLQNARVLQSQEGGCVM